MYHLILIFRIVQEKDYTSWNYTAMIKRAMLVATRYWLVLKTNKYPLNLGAINLSLELNYLAVYILWILIAYF
jgi:hypothetical protein